MHATANEPMTPIAPEHARSFRDRLAERIHYADARTAVRVGLGLLRHAGRLRPFWSAPRDTALWRLATQWPEVWTMVHSPFVAANWTARQRITRIVDHCRTVEAVGPLLDMPLDAYTRLLTLDEFDESLTVVVDQQRWLLRDGQMTFSLREHGDQLFGLTFCLSSEGGRLVAYIGGMQGRREEGILDRYRRVTKTAHGMRPSDLTVDLFRLFCAALGVEQILAVADANRYHRSSYFKGRTDAAGERVLLSYDELWAGRGGQPREDGFFDLQPALRQRPIEDVPPNKRSLYRRRYAALESIRARMRDAVAGGLRPDMRGTYPPSTD